MSAWRRIAIEKLPKQRDLIARSESVGMLWTDLWFVFRDAHQEPLDEMTIRGVYEFAKWTCAESRDADVATATCCHFYEHLPLEPKVRARLPQFMSRQEILGLSDLFKYHLTPDQHRGEPPLKFFSLKARIRELLRAVPFQPFIIRMADGREYRIDHPDFVLAAASDIPQITIEEPDGRQHYLSALLITSLEHASGITAQSA
jgi:hypothetical protein